MELDGLQINQPFPHSTVFNLADKIEYQQGAIVSKTLVKKETGTVTLFAFTKGQALSEHSAPFDAIVQLVDGKAEIDINKHSFLLQKGDYIIMPANITHSVLAIEDFKMLLTMIKG